MTATISGRRLLQSTIRMPRVGVWHADVSVDGDTSPGSSVTINVDGETFVGTVLRGDPNGSRWVGKVVGGAGKLSTVLPAKNYSSGPTTRAIVVDALTEAGETLSPTSDTATLNAVRPLWQRTQGPASRALQAIADATGATWRVLADGKVWFGVEAYATVEPEHTLIDEDWALGLIEIAPTTPSLRPGVTFRDQRIAYVVHELTGESLRTEAWLNQPGLVFERFLAGIRQAIDYSRFYPARVVAQNADKTLQLVPEDARIAGTGMDRVPIRAGIPAVIEVASGAKCLVGFAGGDPARPYVHGWETTAVTKVSINGGTLPAARQGDLVDVLPAGWTVSLGPVGVVAPASTGTTYPLFFVPPPPANPLTDALPYLYGQISSGNPAIEE